MSFGVTDLFGIDAPSSGYTHKSSLKKSIDVITLRNTLGVTTCVSHTNDIKVEASISGKGEHALGTLAASQQVGVGEMTIVSKKRTETLKEFPDFEVSSKGHLAVSAFTPGVGATPPTPPTPGEGCPVIGITSVGIACTTSFDIEEKLEEAGEVFNVDGSFKHQDFFDPTFSFSVKGAGDFPAVLVLGGSANLEDTVSEFGSGIVMITSVSEEQSNEAESTWEASGNCWPGAV